MKAVTNKTVSSWYLIGALLIILKLCHVIDWSWWCVLLPFWLPVAFLLFICMIVLFTIIVKYGMWLHDKKYE